MVKRRGREITDRRLAKHACNIHIRPRAALDTAVTGTLGPETLALGARHSRFVAEQTSARLPSTGTHEQQQRDADGDGCHQQHQVRGPRVAAAEHVRDRIQARLREVEQPREADHGAVDLAERGDAKHLGAVVRDHGVVERPVCDEQQDVGVRRERAVLDKAEHADRAGRQHQHRQHRQRRERVE